MVTFDPNIRPALAPPLPDTLARVERLVAVADVVKASDEDLAWLYPDSDPLDVLRDWLDLGLGLVVVTRGGVGSDAISAQGLVHVNVPKITVSDTIGAGDSFMARLIVALDERGLANASARQRARESRSAINPTSSSSQLGALPSPARAPTLPGGLIFADMRLRGLWAYVDMDARSTKSKTRARCSSMNANTGSRRNWSVVISRSSPTTLQREAYLAFVEMFTKEPLSRAGEERAVAVWCARSMPAPIFRSRQTKPSHPEAANVLEFRISRVVTFSGLAWQVTALV